MRQINNIYILPSFSDIPAHWQEKLRLSFYLFYRDAIFRSYQDYQTAWDEFEAKDARIPHLLIDSSEKAEGVYNDELNHFKRLKDKNSHTDVTSSLAYCLRLETHMQNLGLKLFNYCIYAAHDTIVEWKDHTLETQCAFMLENNKLKGFIHYRVKQINHHSVDENDELGRLKAKLSGKTVLYISQLGVLRSGEGTGTHLMQTVLSQHNSVDYVHVLFRNFNEKAKNLYSKLGFKEGDGVIAKYYGYSVNDYCSFEMDKLAIRQ